MKEEIGVRKSASVALSAIMVLVVAACQSASTSSSSGEPSEGQASGNPTAVAGSSESAQPSESAFDAESYFAGKTLRVLVGYSAGGGYDFYARLLERHLPEHLPGNPSIVIENMTGGAGTVAAAYLHDSVEPDGLTIGMWTNFALSEVVGDPNLPVQMSSFIPVGDLFPEPAACIVRTDLATTDEEVRDASLVLGNTSSNNSAGIMAQVFAQYMDIDATEIVGYPGSAEIQLAFERGEVNSYCSSVGTTLQTAAPMLESGDAWIWTYFSADPQGENFEELSDEKWIVNLVEDPQLKEYVEVIAGSRGVDKAFWAPPGTPTEVVEVLRQAIEDAANDPELLAEAEQANRVVAFVPGEESQRRLDAMYDIPEDLKEFIASVLLSE